MVYPVTLEWVSQLRVMAGGATCTVALARTLRSWPRVCAAAGMLASKANENSTRETTFFISGRQNSRMAPRVRVRTKHLCPDQLAIQVIMTVDSPLGLTSMPGNRM